MDGDVRLDNGNDQLALEPCWFRWRTEGRMIFVQLDLERSADDPLIGLMASPELATKITDLHNDALHRVLREEFSAHRDGVHLPDRVA